MQKYTKSRKHNLTTYAKVVVESTVSNFSQKIQDSGQLNLILPIISRQICSDLSLIRDILPLEKSIAAHVAKHLSRNFFLRLELH